MRVSSLQVRPERVRFDGRITTVERNEIYIQ